MRRQRFLTAPEAAEILRTQDEFTPEQICELCVALGVSQPDLGRMSAARTGPGGPVYRRDDVVSALRDDREVYRTR